MHASQLAELGSWVAINSGSLVFGEQEQPLLVSTTYWTASKLRVQRWVTALKMFESDFENLEHDELRTHNPWTALEIVVQEVLLSELLTRVWSASVLTHDWYHENDEMHGLAHSVHVSHIEAKNRAIRIMLSGQPYDEAAFDRINALRRKLERWTDLFLGLLPNLTHSTTFAFDRNRVKDFHREQLESVGPQSQTRMRILASSFTADMKQNSSRYAANPDLNREIASGLLACFPSDRFDSLGIPKSTQTIWLEKSQRDTQMLVDQLLAFEDQAQRRV